MTDGKATNESPAGSPAAKTAGTDQVVEESNDAHLSEPEIQLGYYLDKPYKEVTVSREDAARHTAILAQSGGGKSFFLGLYVEEILLKTVGNVLVIDTNGDFERFSAPCIETFYDIKKERDDKGCITKAERVARGKDDLKTKISPLCRHNKSMKEFEDHFRATAGKPRFLVPIDPQKESPKHSIHLMFSLFDLPWTDLCREVPQLAPHIAVIQAFFENPSNESYIEMAIAPIYEGIIRNSTNRIQNQFILERIKETNPRLDDAQLRNEYNNLIRKQQCGELDDSWPDGKGWWDAWETHIANNQKDLEEEANKIIEELRHSAAFFTDRVLDAVEYFAQKHRAPNAALPDVLRDFVAHTIHSYCDKQLVSMTFSKPTLVAINTLGENNDQPLLIASVANLNPKTRKEVVLALLKKVWGDGVRRWQAAHAKKTKSENPDIFEDDRLPLFVVIDEAHNFSDVAPERPTDKALNELLQRFVAEGRKYGLFLVLASQRPAKIRKGILAECENVCLLRLQSPIEQKTASETWGIPLEEVARTKHFNPGDGLLYGRWVPSTTTFHAWHRRTEEGGASLNKKFWTLPRNRHLSPEEAEGKDDGAPPPVAKE